MDIDRITRPLRLATGSRQPGSINRARGARSVGIVGMAALAAIALGADPVANATPTDFIAAAQAAGVTGVGPAILANGNNVCWEIWNGGYTGQQAAAALQKNSPTLTTDQAAHFVTAAYQDLCPVPGSYDYWVYGNGSPG
jgi:hypothetical protein